jgi:hypothetical protein
MNLLRSHIFGRFTCGVLLVASKFEMLDFDIKVKRAGKLLAGIKKETNLAELNLVEAKFSRVYKALGHFCELRFKPGCKCGWWFVVEVGMIRTILFFCY